MRDYRWDEVARGRRDVRPVRLFFSGCITTSGAIALHRFKNIERPQALEKFHRIRFHPCLNDIFFDTVCIKKDICSEAIRHFYQLTSISHWHGYCFCRFQRCGGEKDECKSRSFHVRMPLGMHEQPDQSVAVGAIAHCGHACKFRKLSRHGFTGICNTGGFVTHLYIDI